MKENNYQSELFQKSLQVVPGGVHSPVRSFKGLNITPRFMTKAKGAYITDVEGKDYIDFCMSFGPLILGHANSEVCSKLKNAIDNGLSFGACEPYSLELAEFFLERTPPHIEQIRFVNSGTEAVMTAIRLARGYTKRDKILKFNGCYHGHTDSMLIKAGSGLAGTAEASSAGIASSIAQDTFILDLRDEGGVEDLFKRHKNEIAAIIIEPLPANNGLLKLPYSYLRKLRKISEENGALLIFDEVISGLRCGLQGMMGKTGIKPDIVTYGKIIGGGLPVGAIAGSRKIMETLAPIGPVYQAGTLSANPLAMVAGLETLKLLNDSLYSELQKNMKTATAIFSEWFQNFENGKYKDFHIISEESLFWITTAPNKEDLNISDFPETMNERFKELFEELLQKGIYLSPNAYEVGFLSSAHNQDVLEDLKSRLWN